MHNAVANAIFDYVGSQVQIRQATRRFFRLDGFDDGTYIEFLHLVKANDFIIEGQPVWVRTTKSINKFEDLALEEGKSSTWYRNHLPSGHALVLIFNSYTTDAQSLKDIFPITESTLATRGLTNLIDAAALQASYQLNHDQLDTIINFIRRLRNNLFSPQLRDLVEFLIATTRKLALDAGTRIDNAISTSLPYLGLFASTELTKIFDSSRGDRLLKDNYKAALLGSTLIDDRDMQRYNESLSEIEFDDDSGHGGLSHSQKRDLIFQFLSNVITDRSVLIKTLEIDWREVSPVLHKRTRKTKADKRRELAAALTLALEDQQIEITGLSDSTQEAVQDIADAQEPKDVDVESLIDELGDILPKDLRNKLKRLRGAVKLQTDDYVAGLVRVIVDLYQLVDNDENITDNHYVTVEYSGDIDERVSSKRAETLAVFSCLYGGIDKWIHNVSWDLSIFWTYAKNNARLLGDEEDEEGQREKVVKDNLVFKVSIREEGSQILASADLIWLYRSDGPQSLTALHLHSLQQAQEISPLKIPVYNTCADSSEIGDLDLSRPIASFGTWYHTHNNLRDSMSNALLSRLNSDEWEIISRAFDVIETSWNNFVKATSQGLYTADIIQFLSDYEAWLSVISDNLQYGETASYGFRELVKAWVVGHETYDDWAIIPLLHPIKLQWWIARVHSFNVFIGEIINNFDSEVIIDEKRFQNELSVTFSSAQSPAILALPGNDQRVNYFLPVNELHGYELYRHEAKASVAYGLDPELVSETEGEQAVQTAAHDIARIIQSYVETYPFVQDGLEIYIVQCRDGSLPGNLVDRLDKISRRRGWDLRVNLIIHTTDRGAPLFQRVSGWISANEHFEEKLPGHYFPQITMKVLECDFDELFNQVDDTDLVILADVLAERGQNIGADSFTQVSAVDSSVARYMPSSRTVLRPFERRERLRRIDLFLKNQPTIFWHFYNLQWAARERRTVPKDGNAIQFYLEISLSDWEKDLNSLHKKFNWVICYDPTVDRFLLQATAEEAVQVIRYSLGLGPKRRHNLTVSSSRRAQDTVVNRLASNLKQLLPTTPHDFREKVALRLVEEAKSISGDIVLRAAGPGAYLNELIGMIVAKTKTELVFKDKYPSAISTWIYLDDFAHWFDRKFPDLLFVAILPQEDTEFPLLHIEVIETKCVSENSFNAEAIDAQRQVAQGVNRLFQVWKPGSTHIDSFYWYEQFRKAVVGNLDVERSRYGLLDSVLESFSNGQFLLDMSGHSWVLCYDSNVGIRNGSEVDDATITAPDIDGVRHLYHHVGRSGLRQFLKFLVEEKWEVSAPEDAWLDEEIPAIEPLSDSISTSGEVPNPYQKMTEELVNDQGELESQPKIMEDDSELKEWIQGKAKQLTQSLRDYDIKVYPVDPNQADIGPSIVRYKIQLRPGEKLSRLQNIAVDIQRPLELETVPIIENVSGTRFIGIDIPHPSPSPISQFELLEQLNEDPDSYIPFLVGITPDGNVISADFKSLKHLLVSGSTGSGKTILLYSLMVSLLYKFKHQELYFIIIDPKQTDFVFFEDVPHLLGKQVVIEPEDAIEELLNLTEDELPIRTQRLRDARCRDIQEYNLKNPEHPLAPIVVIIDEYADLVQILSKKERENFETQMVRLAQRARNVGIHLVIATQRPSSDIVTSKLKTNLPARIAFRLPSYHDSMTILDQTGAENLLGRGDMLFKNEGRTERLQGLFVDTESLNRFLGDLGNK